MAGDAGLRRPIVHTVSSARSAIGKTLYARLLAAYIAATRAAPLVFDTDTPDGDLLHYPETGARLVDLARLEGQMALFDTLLATPGIEAVVDLSRSAATQFRAVAEELDFFSETPPGGLLFVHHFVVDPSDRGLTSAWQLSDVHRDHLRVVVENRRSFDPVFEAYPEAFWAITPFATIGVPAVPPVGHAALVDPAMTLRDLATRQWSSGSPVLDQTLRRFVAIVFEQFRRLDLRIEIAASSALGG